MKGTRTITEVIAEKYLGQPLAILCTRYWYRGIVAEAGRDYVTLSHVRAVEVTGPAASASPDTEDPVPSDLTISTAAIEQFCQPLWVWHEMADHLKVPKDIQLQIKKARRKERQAVL